jgi:hypothetical protein
MVRATSTCEPSLVPRHRRVALSKIADKAAEFQRAIKGQDHSSTSNTNMRSNGCTSFVVDDMYRRGDGRLKGGEQER